MECNKCGHTWKARIKKPLSCPRCKRRFDYPKTEVKHHENNAGVKQNLPKDR